MKYRLRGPDGAPIDRTIAMLADIGQRGAAAVPRPLEFSVNTPGAAATTSGVNSHTACLSVGASGRGLARYRNARGQ